MPVSTPAERPSWARMSAMVVAAAGGATSIQEGGRQIEYKDQDPRIHAIWLNELRRTGVKSQMDAYLDETTADAVAAALQRGDA